MAAWRRRKTAWAAQIVALNLVEVHQVVDAALENERRGGRVRRVWGIEPYRIQMRAAERMPNLRQRRAQIRNETAPRRPAERGEAIRLILRNDCDFHLRKGQEGSAAYKNKGAMAL